MKKIKSLLRKITRKKYVNFSGEEIGVLDGSLSDITTTKSPQHTCYPDMMYIACHDEGREVEEKGPITNWWETEGENYNADDANGKHAPYIWLDQSAWTGEKVQESGYDYDHKSNPARKEEKRVVSTIEDNESYHQLHTLSKNNLQSPIIQVHHVASQQITEDREPRNDRVGYVDGERQAYNDDDGLKARSEGRMDIPEQAEDAEQTPVRVMVGLGDDNTVYSNLDRDDVASSTTHNDETLHNTLVQSGQGNLHNFQSETIGTINNDDEPPYLPLIEDSDVSTEHLNTPVSTSWKDPETTLEIPETVLQHVGTSEIQTSYSSSTENESFAKISRTEERRPDITEEESLQCLLYSYYREIQSRLDMEKIEQFMLETRMEPDQYTAPGSQNHDQSYLVSDDSSHGNGVYLHDSYSSRDSKQHEIHKRTHSFYNLMNKNAFETRDVPSLVNESLLASKLPMSPCDRSMPLGDVREINHLNSVEPSTKPNDLIHNLEDSERAVHVSEGDDHQECFIEDPFQVDSKNKLPVGYLIALFESIARRGNGDPSSHWNAMTNGIKLLHWHSCHTLHSHKCTSNADRKSPPPSIGTQTSELREAHHREEINTNDHRQLQANDYEPRFSSSIGNLYAIEEGDESILEEEEPPVLSHESSHLSNLTLQANEEPKEHGCDLNLDARTEDKCISLYDTATMLSKELDTYNHPYPPTQDQSIHTYSTNDMASSAPRDVSVIGHAEDWTTRPKKVQNNFVEVQFETSKSLTTANIDIFEPVHADAGEGHEQVKDSLGPKFQGSVVQQTVSLLQSVLPSTKSERCTLTRDLPIPAGDDDDLSSNLKVASTPPTKDRTTTEQPEVSNISSHSRRSHDGDSWWIGNSRSRDTKMSHPRIDTQDEAVECTKDYINKGVRRNPLNKHRQRDLDTTNDIPYEVTVKPRAKGASPDKQSKETKNVSNESTGTSQAKRVPSLKQRHYYQDDDRAGTTSEETCVDLRAHSFPAMKQRSRHYYELPAGTKSPVSSLNTSAKRDQSPKHRRQRLHESQKTSLKASVNSRARNVFPGKQGRQQLEEKEDESHKDRDHRSAESLPSSLQRRQPGAEKISHESRDQLRSRNAPSLKQRCQHFYEVEKSSSVNPRARSAPSRKHRHQHVHSPDNSSREDSVKERSRFVSSQKLRHHHFYEVGKTSQEESATSPLRDSRSVKKRHQHFNNEREKGCQDVRKALPTLVDDNSLRSLSERTRTLLSASDDALVGPTLSPSPSDEGEDFSQHGPYQGTETQDGASEPKARRGYDDSGALCSNAGSRGYGRINVERKSIIYQTSGHQNSDRIARHKNPSMHNTKQSRRQEASKIADLGGRAFSHISALAGFVASGLRPDVSKSTSVEFLDPEFYNNEQEDLAAFAHGNQARDDRSSVKDIYHSHMLETDIQSLSPSDEASDKLSDEEDVHKDFPTSQRRHQEPKNASNDRVTSSTRSCDELMGHQLSNESFYDCYDMGESAAGPCLSPTDEDSHKADFIPSDEEGPETKVSMDHKSICTKEKRSSERSHHKLESRAHAAKVPQEVDVRHDEGTPVKSRSRKSPSSSSSPSSHRKPNQRVAKQSSTRTRKDRHSRSTRHAAYDSFETSFFQNLSPMARMRHQRQMFDNDDVPVPVMHCF